MSKVAKWLCGELVKKTTSREAALKDADFVINTALVGGHDQHETQRTAGEKHLGIIEGLTLNKEDKFQVNIPNNGLIEDIPDDVVVEVPAIVNKTGIRGIQVGKLPKNLLLQVLWPRMLEMEREVELALSSDRRLFLRMILDDHRTKSLEQAKAIMEEILSLPFNREMAENMAE